MLHASFERAKLEFEWYWWPALKGSGQRQEAKVRVSAEPW
jgi:hypothetical protein